MVDHKQDPPGRGAGWVVAAIVAVVAICAVSFMVTQRPQEAIAVAEGDPLTSDMLRGSQSTPGGAAEAIRVRPLATPGGQKRLTPKAEPTHGSAMDANAAASNASAFEPAR